MMKPFKEWIPHWIHTGHLHIDGLKMSKSLKNFVTIRSLLQSDASSQESLFHSPSDDFRLWCLGLSGSYRGPATYSETRLKEAKVWLLTNYSGSNSQALGPQKESIFCC